jgi:hypothetical protein
MLGDHSPLFPTSSGGFPRKRAVVDAIIAAAQLLHLNITHSSGASAFGGHSLRRGGAQYLARAGVGIWRIQALARHSAIAILGYVADAHISSLSTIASEPTTGRAFESLRGEFRALQGGGDRARRVSLTPSTPAPSGGASAAAAVSTDTGGAQAVPAVCLCPSQPVQRKSSYASPAAAWHHCMRLGMEPGRCGNPLSTDHRRPAEATRCFARDTSPPTSASSGDD